MDNATFVSNFSKYRQHGNWFKDLDPLTKLDILLVIGFTGFLIGDYRYTLCACVFAYIFAAIVGELKSFNMIFSKLLIAILLFIVVVRQLSVQGTTVLFSIFGWKWTYEALVNGLNVGGKLLLVSAALILFFNTTEMRDLMYSLEKRGVSHEVSYVILSSFQSIIDLKESANTILESQKARGIETEGNMIHRIKAFLPILSPLLLGAMTSTELKSIAMDARAFSADTKHTFLCDLKPMSNIQKCAIVIADILFLGLIVRKIVLFFL